MGGSKKLLKSLGLIKFKTPPDDTEIKAKKTKKKKWKFWKSTVHAASDKQDIITRKPNYPHGSEDWAALVIQTTFRGYMARRTLRALKGVVRLQALVRGRSVRKQASITLRCMQTLVKVQRARQTRLSEASAMRGVTQKQTTGDNKGQDPEKEWSDSVWTKEEIRNKIQQRHEAAVKRERALAYAFSHQWRAHPRPTKNAENPEWEWGWLERWMAARPWESQAVEEALKNGIHPKHASKSPLNGVHKEHELIDSPKSVQSSSRFQGSDKSSPGPVKAHSTPPRTTEQKPTANGVEKPVVKSRYMNPRSKPVTPASKEEKPRSNSLPKQRPKNEEHEMNKKRLSLPAKNTKDSKESSVTPTRFQSPAVTPKKKDALGKSKDFTSPAVTPKKRI